MNKTTLIKTFGLFLFSIIGFSQSQAIEFKVRPENYAFYEFRNDSVFALKTVIPSSESLDFESKLPYPIIFIHGLNSSSETWNGSTDYFDTQYNFTFGGRFDFCLNADNNNATTNKNFYPTPNADIAAFESFVQNGDYYYVNFNVNPDGAVGTTVLSNQSAVAKQGTALKIAVQRVLEITGKDKVILVGHSMGGLASREYFQNIDNWQIDGMHHVAKFLSVGTPHGGSNASDSGLGWFAGIETHSEAIRDLKTTYYYSGDQGRFLFGGIEINNSSNMNEHLFGDDFYNYDVNCNGIIGETILGLNQKPMDNFIDYSCVIGRITGGTTDGVVAEPSSNLNHFYGALTFPAKLFYFNSGFDYIENHTELPGYPYQIMQGLDEPNFKELAYYIVPNKNYIGFSTVQNPVNADDDFYKFSIAENVTAIVAVNAIATSTMSGTILDASGTPIGLAENNSGNTMSFTRTLTAGDYYLKLTSTNPTNTNYETPYRFVITTTLNAENLGFEGFTFYPNPVVNTLFFGNISLTKASVYSVIGQLIATQIFDSAAAASMDFSNLESGMYLIVLENNINKKTIKVVKE
jgi:pimeloyl-ACP methyl ester carboxylesterase